MPKRGRPKTLEFTPTKRKNYAQRKNNALIDWTDSSKQAHVLDWRHRAQEFGLAVEIRDELEDAGQAYAPSPERILREEEPEAFEDQPVRAEAEEAEAEEEEQLEAGAPAGSISSASTSSTSERGSSSRPPKSGRSAGASRMRSAIS